MKRILRLVFIFALLVFSASAADLTGVWRMEVVRRGGVTLRTYFIFHQTGGSFDGRMIINDVADLPLRHVNFEGPDVLFSNDWNTEYRIHLDGDKLSVTVTYGKYGSEEATAVRVEEAETRPPAALPLPVLAPVAANGLAQTPPMGWNSWNHFSDKIDDPIVRETTDMLVKTGLAAAGYIYVNIDDSWEGGRDAAGNILANEKFPNMKALADYVHSRGLKLGIYSSPGPRTCGGYEGSYGHEEQDAKTFAAWGIDYLKYDWCSAGRIYPDSALQAAYQHMGDALLHCGRPIVYSLCEYGTGEVWKWGPQVGGNLWRTTGDIQDNWKSMSEIGFNQSRLAEYAAPGHWNDPDMLEVGNGGMTVTEYRTHFSLWCLLAAPLMAGNDLRTMSMDTREILSNREVIAIDQDVLGKAAVHRASHEGLELWSRPLADHSQAVAVFNRSDTDTVTTITWTEFGFTGMPKTLRDLWQHRDLRPSPEGYSASVPAHGVLLLRVQ